MKMFRRKNVTVGYRNENTAWWLRSAIKTCLVGKVTQQELCKKKKMGQGKLILCVQARIYFRKQNLKKAKMKISLEFCKREGTSKSRLEDQIWTSWTTKRRPVISSSRIKLKATEKKRQDKFRKFTGTWYQAPTSSYKGCKKKGKLNLG